MLDTLGIVQIRLEGGDRMAASRLETLARRNLGGKSLLEWVVRRVTDCQQLDGVIALAADEPEYHRLARLVPPDVPVFLSKQRHPLGRLAAALREYPARSIVRVGIDSPFVDPALIDRLVITAAAHPECDYVGYCSRDGQAGVRSRIGVFAEWCRAKAVFRAEREVTDAEDRCDVTRYVCSHPELFQLRLIPIPDGLDRDDVRLTIREEDDWDHAQAIVEALGPESLDWQRIAGLLDHQPALRKRMAVLNRAEANVG